MWQSAYLLTRLAERVSGEVKGKVHDLRDRLSADNFRAIETVGLAARWAEALTKKERTEQEEKNGTTRSQLDQDHGSQ
jgi:hypothetical protein